MDKVELHPVVKKITTLVGYAMLEYHDSKDGRFVDKQKLSKEEMTLYLSQLHSRVFQELENNKDFRSIVLTASKLILAAVSGGEVE